MVMATETTPLRTFTEVPCGVRLGSSLLLALSLVKKVPDIRC